MALDTTDIAVGAPRRARADRKAVANSKRRIFASSALRDVEPYWRELEEKGIESPEQSFDFTRVWVETFGIPSSDQCFVVAEQGGRPLVLLALKRQRFLGINALVPFAGCHVGAHGPLVDSEALSKMTADERRELWRAVADSVDGADMIYLPHVPVAEENTDDVLGELGKAIPSDILYRTQFDSWEACDAGQRSRSRRKHDKQQGAKLAAMGEVTFEEIDTGPAASEALDILFRDRATRFAAQGIEDPFAAPKVRAFYRSVLAASDVLKGKLHVLRLDGEIVAVRYNLVWGERMFCLISAMSLRPELQPGSPGKQIMVHLMQRIFGQGIRMFDMGVGFSDEKRHWCNVQVPLKTHYLPLNARGEVIASLHRQMIAAKAQIKANRALFDRLKDLRTRLRGGQKPVQNEAA